MAKSFPAGKIPLVLKFEQMELFPNKSCSYDVRACGSARARAKQSALHST